MQAFPDAKVLLTVRDTPEKWAERSAASTNMNGKLLH